MSGITEGASLPPPPLPLELAPPGACRRIAPSDMGCTEFVALGLGSITEGAALSLDDAHAYLSSEEGDDAAPPDDGEGVGESDALSDTSGFSDGTSLADDEEAALAMKEVAEMAMEAYRERRHKTTRSELATLESSSELATLESLH